MLSLPMFAIMPKSVRRGFVGLSSPKGSSGSSSIRPYTMLALNLLTQLICVAGVNQLSSVCTSTFFYLHVFSSLLRACLVPQSVSNESARFPSPFVLPISPFVSLFIHSLLFYLFQ
jgi:hypothetical protein